MVDGAAASTLTDGSQDHLGRAWPDRAGRSYALATLLDQLDGALVGQRPQPALADQLLVDAAEPAAVGRVDRRAERDRLAVHRPAGRDREVGERDQALGVDRVGGDDHRRQPQRDSTCSRWASVRGITTAETSSRRPRHSSTRGNSWLDLR